MIIIAPNPSHTTNPQVPLPRTPARGGMLILALSAGLAAALLAFLLVRSHTPAGTSAPETLSVAAASRAIPARTRLTAALLLPRLVPIAQVPEGSYADTAELVGKITAQSISAGSPITKEALAAPGSASGLAFALPATQRAVTIALDPADGIDAFAFPGDHVDILVTDEPGSGPAQTRTVLQNVSLLAVGTKTAADSAAAASLPPTAASGASHVTVGVSPLQAQALVLAAARGKIHLSLRSASDTSIALIPPALPERNVPASPVLPPHPKPYRRLLTPPKAAESLPPIPLSPLPVFVPKLHPTAVTITVVKGSQSQTVSVAP